MNLVFRLAWIALTARFRPRVDLLGPARTRFRVLPTDCDVLLHVNNGVYLSLMDLGRVDLMLRSGLFGELRSRGWYPVVAGLTIQYLASLNPFERFVIDTRIVGWDERSFYVEQRFLRGGAVVAQA
ncbi:MAG TPA: acyl-CoA thioesterase, partial [Gemmatimonadaceae bacterium]